MNGIKLYKLRSIWQSIHRKQQECCRDIFCFFFLWDEEFVSKTINDSNTDLNKFSTSKVRQLAKKMGSSKATAKHIKQVANEPQANQAHLMRHQCTELPINKFQRKWRKCLKSRQATNRHYQEDKQRERIPQKHRRNIIVTKLTQVMQNTQMMTDITNVVIPKTQRDSNVLLTNISAEIAINLVILVVCATRSKKLTRRGLDHLKHTSWQVADYLYKIIPYTATQVITHQVMNHSVCKCKWRLIKLKPSHQHHSI